MMILDGKATIDDGDREYSVSVSFDLEHGRCLIFDGCADSRMSSLGLWLATKGQIFLRNAVINHGDSRFFADELGPFILSSCNRAESAEDNSIAQSGLAAAFGIDKFSTEIDEIELKPLSSDIVFQVNKPVLDNNHEILFHCDPKIKLDCVIKLDGKELRVHTFNLGTPLAKYVRCVSSELNLSGHIKNLRTALSLFFRRRVFLHFIRNQSEISINLVQPSQVISYGTLIANQKRYGQVLEELANSSMRPRKHFLIEAFSNPGTLEVRLLNAFVHLEILDGGRTLSANRVASALGISRENADALVCMRNIMIHDGLGVRDALVETRQRLKNRKGGKKTAEIIEQAFITSSPHGNFYAALMDVFSRNLVNELGFPKEWVKGKVALSF